MQHKIVILLTALLIALLLAIPAPFRATAQEPTAEPTVEVTAQPDVDVSPVSEEVVAPPFPVEIPEKLPETASEGVDFLAIMLGALAGLVSKYLTNGIKDLPGLTEGDKSKISGPAAILLAGVVSIITGYVLSYAGVAANFLDTSGVWQVLVTAWPWAVKFYNDSRKPDGDVHTMKAA